MFSRPVLIGRGLDSCSRSLSSSRGTLALGDTSAADGPRNRKSRRDQAAEHRFGGHGGGETPGPIPNPEVKPSSADGTALATGWESRSPPRHLVEREPPSGGPSAFRGVSRSRPRVRLTRPSCRRPCDPCPASATRDAPDAPPAAASRATSWTSVRQTARPAQAEAAIAHLERAIELLGARRPPGGGQRGPARRRTWRRARRPSGRCSGSPCTGRSDWREALREMQAYRRMTGRPDQNHIIADCLRAPRQSREGRAARRGGARGPRFRSRREGRGGDRGRVARWPTWGKFDEALGLLRRLSNRADVGRDRGPPRLVRDGRLLAQAGRPEEAAREFRKITRHDRRPRSTPAEARLARGSS